MNQSSGNASNGYLQIAELDATNATEASELAEAVLPVLRKTYLWDPMEPIATRVLAMSLFDETGAYQEDLYYTHDALKNTTALFGIKAGRRALYEYGPYGNTVKQEGDAAELNPFRFSSEYFDEETALVQYSYRYLNPADGRWISKDPLSEKGGINLYEFIFNNIGMYIDWLGLSSKKPGCPDGSTASPTKCRYKGKCRGSYHYHCYCVTPGAWFMPEHMSSATEDYISSQNLGQEFDRFWCCCSGMAKPKEIVLLPEKSSERELTPSNLSLEKVAVGAAVVVGSVAVSAAIIATAPAQAVACVAIVVVAGIFSLFD